MSIGQRIKCVSVSNAYSALAYFNFIIILTFSFRLLLLTVAFIEYFIFGAMYVVVILTATKTKLVIPIQWFESIDFVQVFRVGISKAKVHKIFYDSDLDSDPNFRLPIRNEFDANGPNPPACYHAKVLQGFGEYIFILIVE